MDKLNLDRFREYLNRRTRPNTVKTYMSALQDWESWLNGKKPGNDTAQGYLDDLDKSGKAPNTVACSANAIRKWFKWQRKTIVIDAPKITIGDPKYLEMEQIERLISACSNPLERALIIPLFDTACRISEYLNLEVPDIDWEQRLITIVGKGGRIADVNISERAMETLKAWLDIRKSNSKRVFMDLDYNDALAIIKKIGKRAKVDLTPHMLRHSRAIQMLGVGTEPHIVQQHLRHSSIGTTLNVYGRFRPMRLKEEIPPW